MAFPKLDAMMIISKGALLMNLKLPVSGVISVAQFAVDKSGFAILTAAILESCR
ncbi:MAG: hypothetical protein IPK50_16410 [Fibrobacterota bacterium]|nr:MAG: hypothetical protein IPK50_16410 [Fibrobacterota bacterium]